MFVAHVTENPLCVSNVSIKTEKERHQVPQIDPYPPGVW